MALTKITTNVIADDAITTDKISNTVVIGGPKIANVQYADASFTVLDDTAANTSGTARLIINGEDFQSGVVVIVGTAQATSTTLVSSTQLRANVTAQAAGSYPIYVQNSDGGTAIRVNGVTFSNTPVWSTSATLSNQAANASFNVSVSATSDSNVTYSNTTALPAGTQLLSNGYFYGTVTIGAETTYTFDVKATDAQNQDATRTFSLTVTVGPKYELLAWGRNGYGQLGIGNIIDRSSPVQVGSDNTWDKISVSSYNPGLFPIQDFSFSIATKLDGTLWAWGFNTYGMLGQNDQINRSSPVQIGTLTTWNKIETSTLNVIATKTDGTLWTWGYNDTYGQLGLNDKINRSSPTQVGTSTTWNNISIGKWSVLTTKTDGTLWSWGDNSLGPLGQNNRINLSSPVQVGSDTTWNKVEIDERSSYSIKTDNSLWVWGYNYGGVLGLNDQTHRSSPVQLGTNTNWSLISAGGRYSASAVKTNGTLWAWGGNSTGQLGLNDTAYRSSPSQVGSDTNWNKISFSFSSMIATKTTGTLWAWGYNIYGNLGLNSQVNKSSPTQVGTGTTWNNISSGGESVLATRTA